MGSYGEPPTDPAAFREDGEWVKRFTVQELATVIAREPKTTFGQLCASELRNLEAWQTPAKWALWISIISLIVSIAAISVAI